MIRKLAAVFLCVMLVLTGSSAAIAGQPNQYRQTSALQLEKLSMSPQPVTDLKIGGRASNALRLNWVGSDSASGYIIEQYKEGEWKRIARLADPAVQTYRAVHLFPSTTYKFRVMTFDFEGTKPVYSSYASVNGTTLKAVPATLAPVQGLKTVSRTVDSIRLGWSQNSSASGYILEQYKNGKWTRIAKITNNQTIFYKISNLTDYTSYQFRIKGYIDNGAHPVYSSYTTIGSVTLPMAVTGLNIGTRTSGSLQLNWSKVEKSNGYIIEIYKDGSWKRLMKTGSNGILTYRASKLSPRTLYQFRICTYGFDGKVPLYSSYQYVSGTTETSQITPTHPKIVYWTASGSVYHLSKDCPTLKRSKKIQSGSIAESKKSRVCNVCGH